SSAGTGCPCGTGLTSTKVEPSGKELTTSTQTDIVVTVDMAFQVTVSNTGKSQVFGVPVTLTIEQSKGGNIVKHTKIDFLNPGESVRNVSIVRYDAYEDTGGHQSASLAVLDSTRTGVVVTAIQGRDYARIYMKELDRGKASVALSPEEAEAVERAMSR